MGPAEKVCRSCGAAPPEGARFCSTCGSQLAPPVDTAMYKQVTVLFADVVRSMDIAAALDVERLREIMTELVERSAAVVQRYGGGSGADGDVTEAEAVIERLATAPADDGLAIRDVWLLRLRALVAQAHGDARAYADVRDRYRAMAESLGYEGHIRWAAADKTRCPIASTSGGPPSMLNSGHMESPVTTRLPPDTSPGWRLSTPPPAPRRAPRRPLPAHLRALRC